MQVNKPLTVHVFRKNLIKIFLAGSIEMGTAVDWQKDIENRLKDYDGYILNPRRENWDNSLVQEIENDQFRGQVEWELDGMESADIIFMYFAPETKSSISLLELGLHAKDEKLMVCCPDGFWRKGNAEVVCNKFEIPLYNDLDTAVEALIECIKSYYEYYETEMLNKQETGKPNETETYLFDELKNPEFERSFFENLPKLLSENETDIKKSIDDVTLEDLEYIGDILGINWEEIDKEQLKHGIIKESGEHGDITNDNLIVTAKIVLSHLREFPDYYNRLEVLERDDFWNLIDKEKRDSIIFFITENNIIPENPIRSLFASLLTKEQFATMYREFESDFYRLFDKSSKLVYNDINQILGKMVKKAQFHVWESEKTKYRFITKNENGLVKFIDYQDIPYFISNNYNIERIKKV